MSSAPLPYERVTNFYSFEQSYPTSPKRGADLDAEFNAVRITLNATQERLAEIQRDDGLLANSSVHPQALTSETFVLLGSDFVPRGSWMTATTYNPGDLVEHAGLNYLATVTHVSNDFDIDLASGRWQAFGGYPTAAQVVFAPAGSVGSVSVQQAIEELDSDIQAKQGANANLAALSALVGQADRVIYFTGAGAMALAVLTAQARSLLAAGTPEAQRTAIGVEIGTGAGNVIALDGSGKLPAVDGSQLIGVVLADASVTAAKLAGTLDLSAKTLTLPSDLTTKFSKEYTSPQQTITAAGSLALAHGLPVKPKLIQLSLVCATGELGYTAGDEVFLSGGMATEATANRGVSIVPDTTNVNVRYGSAATVFVLPHKTTGVATAATNANWRLVIRAWC